MIDFGSIVRCKWVDAIIGDTHQVIGFSGSECVLITKVEHGHDGFPEEGDVLTDRLGNPLSIDLRDGRKDLYYVYLPEIELCLEDHLKIDKLVISRLYGAKDRRLL